MARSQLARLFRIRATVEVAAMLGDSVVGVARCANPRGGKVTRATWAIAAGGLACLLASAIAFGISVRAAASDAEALERHTRVLGRPAYSFRPHRASDLALGVAVGGLVLGLSALAGALLRAGAERESPFYRIGTVPGVEQPLEGAPSACFPLVAPSGDDFVLNYAPGIEGELIAGGVTTPLSELAASGWARPSATAPGAIEIPIPARAEIRARVGRVTFRVSSGGRTEPRLAPSSASALDLRAACYVAASLATHLAFVHMLPPVDREEVADEVIHCCFCRYQPSEPTEPEPEPLVCTGCICSTVEPPISREEAIELAHDVALTGGIFARTRPYDRDLAYAAAGLDPPAGLDGGSAPEPRAILPSVSVEKGTLAGVVIKRYLQRHDPLLSYCYRKELLARPGLAGVVSIQLVIGPAGDVQRSRAAGVDPTIADCVSNVIEHIDFPASGGATRARVDLRLDYRRRPAGPEPAIPFRGAPAWPPVGAIM